FFTRPPATEIYPLPLHDALPISAREAALQFPRTSNASVALALATLGLDRTEVIVLADPQVTRTRHVVEWESPLGSYEMSFENSRSEEHTSELQSRFDLV